MAGPETDVDNIENLIYIRLWINLWKVLISDYFISSMPTESIFPAPIVINISLLFKFFFK